MSFALSSYYCFYRIIHLKCYSLAGYQEEYHLNLAGHATACIERTEMQ